MDEQAKELVEQIQKGVVEQVMPAVTEEMGKKLEEKFLEQKEMFQAASKSEDEEMVEKKQAAAEFLKTLVPGAKRKTLDTETDDSGAELAPEAFRGEIMRLQPNYGLIRRKAQVIELSEGTTHYPTIGSADVSRVDEKGVIPVVSPSTGRVTFTLKKLAAIIPVSNELLRRSNIALVDWLSRIAAEGFGKAEDQWGFLGLSTGEGIFQNANVPVLTLDSGETTYLDADFDDLSLLQDQLDDDAVEGAEYFMNRTVWNGMRRSKFTDAEGNNMRYVFQDPGNGQPATIWNLPVNFSRVLPRTTETAGLQADKDFMVLGNFDYLMLGDERKYQIDTSEHASIVDGEGNTINLFQQDMTALRFIETIDIQLVEADKAFAILHTAAS